MAASRRKSSARWLKEHADDEFVQRARREGFRSRAVYKLAEIDRKDRLLQRGMTVVDLGAAPGGWCQYCRRQLAGGGTVIGLDVLPIEPIADVTLLQGDFREPQVLDEVLAVLSGRPVDLVISDMAPNTSGIKTTDQSRIVDLAELALDFAHRCLRPQGSLLIKVFQGEGFDALLGELRTHFRSAVVRKPKASRARSPELYLLARNYARH